MYEYLEKIKKPEDVKKLNYEELTVLASEIRDFLIRNVSKTGGHLSSNLGMVELTISLLRNFNFEEDKIVFDVGHQSYPYKILTGRREQFQTLRQYKGLSGFPKKNESKYDFFDTGHSSNSISVALGMAKARDIQIRDFHVVSVIGDGALTGGMAYEGLNDLGFSKTKMIVILNDNQMSISPNVGGLSEYLTKIRINKAYNNFKRHLQYKLDDRRGIINFLRKIKNSIRTLFVPSLFFEDLGIKYVGPIDGHNIKELDEILEKVKELSEPVVVHVITKKGKGYEHAEEKPNKFHGVAPFDVETGEILKKSEKVTYSKAFGDALIKIAKNNKDVVAITAAMAEGTGLVDFARLYPNRLFDVGIAEQHAVSFAAGLASQGLKPVFAVYSTFLQRGFDQIIEDVCLQNLPVVFMIDRAGLVGNDGETHQGIFDISYLSMIPNLTILTPKCTEEVEVLLKYALSLNRPVAIRYPRGGDKLSLKPIVKVEEYKWDIVSQGSKVAIVACGNMVQYAMMAKELLKDAKVNPMVISATFIKPLDTAMIKRLVREKYNILTLEDNIAIGGFGSLLLKSLSQLNYRGKFRMMAFKDKFIEHGSVEELYRQEKMDVESIAKTVKKLG
ncbi:MAG: 1-deoxy-D-xylulose-5-phosphate synthase [Clostridia bacterium]|nr:1-deoxy-D-xylulose-5-phosphate synthase [Clostridia bacterium]